MKKIFKIVGFSMLGFIVLVIGIAVLVSIFVPEEELEQIAAERAAANKQKSAPSPAEKPVPEPEIAEETAPQEKIIEQTSSFASIKNQVVQIPIPPRPKTEFEKISEKIYGFDSSKRLAKAYAENPFGADAKYKGKTLKLNGIIAKLDRIAGEPYVHLHTSVKPIMLVSCQVRTSQLPILEKLSKDQYIHAIGKVTGSVGISVHLEDCLLSIPKSDLEKMPFKKRLEKASYWVTAENIAKEYLENSDAASAKYEGKIVVVRGVIRNTIDNSGRPAIVLATVNGSTWCFIPVDMKPIIDKKKGQEVFVVGKVKGDAFSLWYLEDCLVGELKG